MIIINIPDQYLVLHTASVQCSFPVSSSVLGVGQKHGSYKTPVGWHYVADKIGDDCAEDVVFKSRKPLSQSYHELKRSSTADEDWIMTRIIRLAGCIEGLNKGDDCDTYQRMIYIHGCPETVSLQKPSSKGCIRMHPKAIIELFNQIQLGEWVLIVG